VVALVPPTRVQELVKPILDALADTNSSTSANQTVAFETGAKLLGELFVIKTSAFDEALAVLMTFYVVKRCRPM
jgi:hypothetical protein